MSNGCARLGFPTAEGKVDVEFFYGGLPVAE